MAASPFDGLWVDDLKTQMGEAGFDKYLIANGTYRCDSCQPPRNYPADGKMRAIPGDPSVISESVTIAGPRTIVTRVLDHEMMRETRMTVAPDDRTATYVAFDKWPTRTKRLSTEYVAKRVAPAPSGSHGIRLVARPALCGGSGGISVCRSQGSERTVHAQQFSSWSLHSQGRGSCGSSFRRWQGYLRSYGPCTERAHAHRDYPFERQAARGTHLQIIR